MTKFLYITGTGSTKADAELRYSLRSVAKHHRARVVIVGHCPKWCKPDKHIDLPDMTTNAAFNTLIKLHEASKQLRGVWVYMNDDFFLNRPHSHQMYYHGSVKTRIATTRGNYTRMLLSQTRPHVDENAKCYECHAPQSLDLKKMRRLLDYYRLHLDGIGYAYITMYGQRYNQLPETKLSKNLKWNTPPADWAKATTGLPSFSVSDGSWNAGLESHLKGLFKTPCKFER